MSWLSSISFLNAGLLIGTAAVAVPIAIHLIRTGRPRVIKWAAMHLLSSAAIDTRRRYRVNRWLLLLIRCLLICSIAFAMARPLLQSSFGSLGGRARGVVILLDNSYSMAVDRGGAGNFEHAKRAAKQILRSLPRGSQAMVIGLSDVSQWPAAGLDYNVQRVIEQVDQVAAGLGPVRSPRSLEVATEQLLRTHHSDRQIVIVSDFQVADWQSVSFPEDVHVMAYAVRSDSIRNVAIERMEVNGGFPASLGENALRVTLSNHDDRSASTVAVDVFVDGDRRSTEHVRIDAMSDAVAEFNVRLDSAGTFAVEARLIASDDLAADNELTRLVQVRELTHVLLLHEDESVESMRGETDFLEVALSPYRFLATGDDAGTDFIASKSVHVNDVDDVIWSDYQVVVIANVRRLPASSIATLRAFVETGGSLMIFPGDKTDGRWFNDTLALGVRLGDLRSRPVESGEREHLVRPTGSHPLVSSFVDDRNGDLTRAAFWAWYALQSEGGRVLWFRNDDPFLVERTHGLGTTLVFASSVDADWNDMPLRPVFAPFMQRMVMFAAGRSAMRTEYQVGDRVVFRIANASDIDQVTVVDPRGRSHAVAVRHDSTGDWIETDQTGHVGLYRVRWGDSEQRFLVQPDRRESRLEFEDPSRLPIDTIASIDDYNAAQHSSTTTVELSFPVLWVALGLLMLELWATHASRRV